VARARRAPGAPIIIALLILTLLAATPAHAESTIAEAPAASSTPAVSIAVQSGHTAEIRALEYARSGKFFVTGAKDSTIKVWAPGGTLIRTIVTGFWVDYLALSRDGHTVLAAQRPGRIELWSLEGKLLRRLPPMPMPKGFVASVALSDDNRLAAVGTSSQNIVVHRLDGGGETWMADGGAASVDALVFTPDGSRLISAHGDGKLRIWSPSPEGRLIKTIAAHDYPIKALALSPDGKTLATAGGFASLEQERVANGQLHTKLWELDGKPVGQFKSHSAASLRFTPDGAQLVSGGLHDNRVHVYTRAGQVVSTLVAGKGSRLVHRVAVSADGQRIVTADGNFNPPGLKIWSRAGELERSLERFNGNLSNVAMAPDGNTFVTLALDGRVRVWAMSGRLLASLTGHGEAPTSLAYAPNGQYFASGGDEVILWSRFGRKLGTVGGFKDGAESLVFSPDSRYLFCGDGAGTVHIFDLKDRQTRRLKVHDARVQALAIHPSGRFFATGSIREHVRIWTVDGVLLGEHKVAADKTLMPVGSAFSLTFTHDGQQLIAGTSNRTDTIRVFDLKAQPVASIKTPHTHTNGGAVLMSPSGRWLAATVNHLIGVYEWPSRKLVRVLRGHTGTVEALAFTPDERHLVSAAHDSTARVWKLADGYSMALLSRGDDWLMYTPDGYFDASHYGGELVAIVRGLDTFSVDQFATALNRPDLVLRRMGIGSEEFLEHLNLHHKKRLQRGRFPEEAAALELEAPEVRLISAKQEGKHAVLEAEIQGKTPLQSYQVYVNGVPVIPNSGKPISGTTARVSERVELGEGANFVEVSAFNARGVEAFRAHWSTTYRGEAKSDLYFIGFGVSQYKNPALNLQFAHKDATDLAALMQRYQNHFRRVVVKTYLNEAVTVDNIRKAKEVLQDAKVDDTVIVFISGHGAYDLSREATYYYATHDVDLKNLAGTAASFDQIEALVRDIAPRRKLMLIDTCESGEIDDVTRADIEAKMRTAGLDGRTSAALRQDGGGRPRRVFLYDRDRYIYNDLTRRTGAIIFTASHAGELSFESPKIQNGFFTREIVEALASGQADANRDGSITLGELQSYVSLNVALKTGGLQRPTTDRDNALQRFGFPVLR
jgi:WD40 repeat protein